MNRTWLGMNTLGALLMFLAHAAPASALAGRTWVSGTGDDANPCTRLQPCATFAAALKLTEAGGEINVVTTAGPGGLSEPGGSGGFGPVTINKSVTIDGGGSFAGILAPNNGIVVNAGNTDVVTLRNLSLNGRGVATNGITFVRGAALHIENCTISQFTWGIRFHPDTTLDAGLYVDNTTISRNGDNFGGGGIQIYNASTWLHIFLNQVRVEDNHDGITVDGSNGGLGYYVNMTAHQSAVVGNRTGFTFTSASGKATVQAMLDGVTAAANGGAGIQANGGAIVILDSITAAGNSGAGVQADGANTVVLLGNSTITLNKGSGVSTKAGGSVFSYKNNKIKFNSPSEGFPLPQVNNAAAPMDPLAALQ
jgi:hypothetical protein